MLAAMLGAAPDAPALSAARCPFSPPTAAPATEQRSAMRRERELHAEGCPPSDAMMSRQRTAEEPAHARLPRTAATRCGFAERRVYKKAVKEKAMGARRRRRVVEGASGARTCAAAASRSALQPRRCAARRSTPRPPPGRRGRRLRRCVVLFQKAHAVRPRVHSRHRWNAAVLSGAPHAAASARPPPPLCARQAAGAVIVKLQARWLPAPACRGRKRIVLRSSKKRRSGAVTQRRQEGNAER